MTPRHAEDLLNTLKQKPLSLDEAHEHARLFGSAWSRDQLELFFLCAPGVERDESGCFRVSAGGTQNDLQAAIAEVVQSFAGKPVPAAQVRARLPGHFVTTDEQVLAFARRTPGLEVFGPGLIRTTKGGA